MEWPFLCSLYIFHNWDNSNVSKKYSIPELIPEINPDALKFSNVTLIALREIKYSIVKISSEREMKSKIKIEPSKIFITIFTDSLIKANEHNLDEISPLDFFQFGLEVLLLFILDVKEKDKGFYNLIEDIGTLEREDADSILSQINMVFEE
jgi:hypothetical protein